ncbi:DUF6708 domain-containing protein [Achromobacter animicus]|uniref:DUF6708 domain-containing protein n=1 Tax=Achromobacter animicus TaxID=1389935 RepID=UPI0028A5FDDF|nr:DUF6708 domain-containing protein [Achromobacter animicus]
MLSDWNWSSKDSAGVLPAIRDQLVKIDGTCLQIRNPDVSDSAFMGRMHAFTLVGGAAAAAWFFLAEICDGVEFDYALLISVVVMLIFVSMMLALRIWLIKSRSNYVFDRSTRKVYYEERGRVVFGDWDSAVGGHQSKLEFTGRAVVVTHSLVLKMAAETVKRGETVSEPSRLIFSVESNEPTEPHALYVAQIWEFIRRFMDEGPDRLPEPAESNWWHTPHHRICLTPAEALRHYVPWRTGEPNEMQGKKNWLLPLWLVLFPFNMLSALSWCLVCGLLKVRSLPPPVQGLGHDDSPSSRRR